jgi:hypothetical protein
MPQDESRFGNILVTSLRKTPGEKEANRAEARGEIFVVEP